jgi:uncharacterized membrane protein
MGVKVSRKAAILVVLVLAVLVTLRVRFAVDQLREMGNGDGNGRVVAEVHGEDDGLAVEGGELAGEGLVVEDGGLAGEDGELHGVALMHEELAEAGWQWLAVGQEPGWRVLADGEGTIALSMIGMELEGYVVDGDVGDTNSFIWKAMVAEESMILAFYREDCTDTMSGFEFAYRVRMEFGDRVYSGCGIALVP